MLVLLRCPDEGSCSYYLGFLRTILSIVLTSAPISWWQPHFCFTLCLSLFGSRFTCLFVHLGLPQASQTQHIPIWTHHHKASFLLCCLFQWMAPPFTPPSYKPGSHPWHTTTKSHWSCLLTAGWAARWAVLHACPTVHRIRVLLHTACWNWPSGLSFNCFPDNWAITWWRFLVRSVSILDGNVIARGYRVSTARHCLREYRCWTSFWR